jgi:hypothetical protein
MPTTFKNFIRVQPKGFGKTIQNLNRINPALKEAIRATVRKGIIFAEKETIRLILERYDISKESLMDQGRRTGKTEIKPIRPGRKGTDEIVGGLEITGTRFPVMRFSVDPTSVPNQKGIPVRSRQIVRVSVRKGSPQVGQPNVFLARMKSGHLGVFRRKPDATHRIRPDGQRTQLNITEEFMLSVPEMLSSKPIRTKFQTSLNKFVRKTFLEETEGQGKKFKGSSSSP